MAQLLKLLFTRADPVKDAAIARVELQAASLDRAAGRLNETIDAFLERNDTLTFRRSNAKKPNN